MNFVNRGLIPSTLIQPLQQDKFIKQMTQKFDLIIIGAGCVGMAAAYYATKQQKRICLIQKGHIKDSSRICSSSFGASQNRIQYNQEYLARFVLASNSEWRQLQNQIGQGESFLHQQGILWFGDKDYDSSQGRISTSVGVLSQINNTISESEKKIDFIYMDKIHPSYPEFMKAFKPITYRGKTHCQWDDWSGLYQPDGGFINSELVYNKFYASLQKNQHLATIYDGVSIQRHQNIDSEYKHCFNLSGNKLIQSKTVLIAVGLHTPHFLKDIMNYPHLVDNNYKNGAINLEYQILQSVVSRIQVEKGHEDFYSKIPAFLNLQKPNDHYGQFSGYGFPMNKWVNKQDGNFIKIGTQFSKVLSSLQQERQYLQKAKYETPELNDFRVQAAIKFSAQKMNHLLAKSPNNKHTFCSNIYFTGRATLLDYLDGKDKSVVVLAGGQIGKCHALIAKTAINMLMQPKVITQEIMNQTVIGKFLSRTKFQLKPFVNDQLNKYNFSYPTDGIFKTIVIGAGCSGLYAAYRLNQAGQKNIGVFDLSERISGRLKSFNFHGTSTPMQLGGMRYIPTNHILVNKIIQKLEIPSLTFATQGDPIQNFMRKAYLRSDYYQMNQWETTQQADNRLITSYRIKGHIVGMNARQVMSYSFYQIITAPENIHLLTELFLSKTDQVIQSQKERLNILGELVHAQDAYYRTWQNYIFQSPQNDLNYNINLSLQQWNRLKPILLFRFPYKMDEIYRNTDNVPADKMYPLYKFGFQNVIEAQFGHQAYQFVSQQNGYYSNTTNASYLDQVMTYLLDFGKVTYRTLDGGFDNINYAMANELLDNHYGLPASKGGIFLKHKLVNIQKKDDKYLLTFHVKTDYAKEETKYQTELLSGVKRSKLQKLVHNKPGELVALPDKPGYYSVQFVAEKLILGMPKKSIDTLYNEVELLQQPLTNYSPIYQSDHKYYEQIYSYPRLKDLKKRQHQYLFLSCQQDEQRLELLERQNAHFEDKNNPALVQEQIRLLNQLSNRHLFSSIIKISKIDYKTELKKINNFKIDTPLVPTTLVELSSSSQSMPAMKIVMNFTKNWWDPNIMFNQQYQKKNKHVNLVNRFEEMRGVSVTDLPIRQTLYFSSGNENFLLGSYNDMATTQFWTTLHNNFSKVWEPTPTTKKNIQHGDIHKIIQYPRGCEIHPAKQVLVREALKQLSKVHNINIKEDWLKECIYQFWGNDIFGGGYHNFHSGYYIPSVMQCIRKPWKDQSIHFVGQAYSNETGWVEGAFQTTEKLLIEQFGLQPLVHGYYAGY